MPGPSGPMKSFVFLLIAIAVVYSSNTKRSREDENHLDSQPSKRARLENVVFDTDIIPTEIWQHICDEVDFRSLPALACVNFTLAAVSRYRASKMLAKNVAFSEEQLTTLLPLALEHFHLTNLPIEEVADRYLHYFVSSSTKEPGQILIKKWRAYYGTENDHLLFDGLVKFNWKNETLLNHQIISNNESYYEENRYQFFYPMALLASNHRKARMIWVNFVAQMSRGKAFHESICGFIKDVFDSLDEDAQRITLGGMAGNHVVTEENSTFIEGGEPSQKIVELEAKIGKSLPKLSVIQLLNNLDNASQHEFEELLSAVQFPLKLFYGGLATNSHPTIMQYRADTEALAERFYSYPIANLEEFTSLSAVRWKLLSTLVRPDFYQHIAGWFWWAKSSKEMITYFFSLPSNYDTLMETSLVSFLAANQGKPIIQLFGRSHWEMVDFLPYKVLRIMMKRLKKDLVDFPIDDPELISKYNEAMGIPEFQTFLELYWDHLQNQMEEHGTNVIPDEHPLKKLERMLPDHKAFFQKLFQ